MPDQQQEEPPDRTGDQRIAAPVWRSPRDGVRSLRVQLRRTWLPLGSLLRGPLGHRNSVRLVVFGAPLLLLVIILIAVLLVYVRLDSNLTTFDGRGIDSGRPPAASPDATGNVPVNVLVIGSDTRDGGNARLGGGSGVFGRSDTTILIHIYAEHRRAVAVSIPRDALVKIPRCRLSDGSWSEPRGRAMFNTAFSVGQTRSGNPACTQNTVEKLTGLRVDHTIVVDFEGFAAMTDAVGGVEICVPQKVYEGDIDPNRETRGEVVLSEGKQTVAGKRALDYVRARHGLGDGSDIGRIKRQQAFLASLIGKVRRDGLNPTTLLPLADAATKALTVDPGLGSTDKLLSFALSLRRIHLDDITFVTVPWRYSGYRVVLVQPDAENLWATLQADQPQETSGIPASPGVDGNSGLPRAVPTPTEGTSGHHLRQRVQDRDGRCPGG